MGWQETVASDEWLTAVRASVRTIGARVEVVNGDGVHQADLPVDSVQVTMQGESSEMWGARFALSDRAYVPLRSTDVLDPRSGMRARVWWRVRAADGSWMEVPVGTYMLEDPEISAGGTLAYTLDGLDPLAEAKRGGYSGATLDLGGMTVTQALSAIFASVAPRMPLRIPDSSVLMPAVYVVGEQEPASDWADIAAMAGWVVRTDREGVVHVGPPAAPEVTRESWQEGEAGCVVLDVRRNLKTSSIVNRVVCTSTSTEVTIPIREVVEDDDPGSATWVGAYGPYETVIRSDKITTVEAARNMARATFERWRRPQETVEVQIPPRPDLDFGDLIAMGFGDPGVAGLYRVSSWSWTASPNPQPMRLTMMTRAAA